MLERKARTMTPHDDLLRSFPARFEIAAFGDAGMALDLETGSYHRLNATALRVCEALKRGDSPSEAAAALVAAFDIDAAEAARAVDATLDHLAAPPPPRKPAMFQVDPDGDGFVLCAHGRPIWRISRSGDRIDLLAAPASRSELAIYAKWVLPHALALQGVPVLHASALRARNGTLAFSGASGAGKSTASQFMMEAGCNQISEDLLLLNLAGGKPTAFAKGEVMIGSLSGQIAAELSSNPGAGFVLGGLDVLADIDGPPLVKILLLDRERRSGTEILEERLDPIDALALLLEGSFAEVPSRAVWKNVWDWSLRLASEVRCVRATMPNGLEALRAAAKDYVKAMRKEE